MLTDLDFGLDDGPIRAMTYSHDGFGLGHLRRTSSIARRLAQDAPGSSVIMLVGCSVGAFFELPPGIDFIKIPSILKADNGVYPPLGLRITAKEVKRLRASAMHTAVQVFRPHLFLVDHVPTGVRGELLPTLRMLRERGDQPVVALGMRDILDDPQTVRKLWRREKTYKAIGDYYDEVLVYGCREMFDAAAEYGLKAELGKRIKYCGYVCSEEPHLSKEEMREHLQVRKDKLIVVTAGGGYDAFPMMQACMEALRLLGKDLPFEIIFITGPLMRCGDREWLRKHAERAEVRVLSHVHGKASYINAADLVITMAGYNSLAEIVSLKKKALVIPRRGPRAEQIMRARIFAERGLVDALYPSELIPKAVAARIMADLERTDYPRFDGTVNLSGGRQAASRLIELTRSRALSLEPVKKPAVSPVVRV